MANTAMQYILRWPLALAVGIGGCGLVHAADSDGESIFDGAFLTISGDIVHDHLAFRSYSITPATRAAFVQACAHGRRIWIDQTSAPCLSASVTEDGFVQVEVPLHTNLSRSSGYYLVSLKPSTRPSLREPSEQELSTLREGPGSTANGSTGPHLSASDLGHAKAVNGLHRSFVFVAHGKDRVGNRPTYVFSIADGRATSVGRLPDWPENLIDIGRGEAPQVIVNLHGDARVIQVYAIWPRVESLMFVGEGG